MQSICNKPIFTTQKVSNTTASITNKKSRITVTHPVQKIQQVQALLKTYETVIILYTYDSILFDVPVTEAKALLPQIKHVLEQGNFPTKVKCGNIYNKLNTISL